MTPEEHNTVLLSALKKITKRIRSVIPQPHYFKTNADEWLGPVIRDIISEAQNAAVAPLETLPGPREVAKAKLQASAILAKAIDEIAEETPEAGWRTLLRGAILRLEAPRFVDPE